MNWPMIGYALLCIVTPMAWGLIVVKVSNMIGRKVNASRKNGSKPEIPPIEYHI